MNQDPNNLNQNNFNTQGDNGIPNNQPLQNNQGLNNTFSQNVNVNQPTFNSQPQVNTNYQQPINNNLNFESPKKNTKLFIIIGIIILIIVAGIILYFVFSQDKADSNNNSSTNVNENITGNDNNNNNNQNNSSAENENNNSTRTALEYFDVSKFDKSKFNGVVYNYDGQYNITDLLAERSNNTGSYRSITVALDGGLRYAFANDYNNWRTMYRENYLLRSDDFIKAILDTLGHPSTYCEDYYDGEYGKTGNFYLYYNYGDYVIFMHGADYRGWKNYNYNYIGGMSASILSSVDFEFASYGTCYGEYANN